METAKSANPPSKAQEGLLAARQKTRHNVARLRERVVESWGRIGQILGDERDQLEPAGSPEADLGKLESAVGDLYQKFAAAEGQLAEAQQHYRSVDTSFRVESVKRGQKRVARLGLFLLLIFFLGASALRLMMAG